MLAVKFFVIFFLIVFSEAIEANSKNDLIKGVNSYLCRRQMWNFFDNGAVQVTDLSEFSAWLKNFEGAESIDASFDRRLVINLESLLSHAVDAKSITTIFYSLKSISQSLEEPIGGDFLAEKIRANLMLLNLSRHVVRIQNTFSLTEQQKFSKAFGEFLLVDTKREDREASRVEMARSYLEVTNLIFASEEEIVTTWIEAAIKYPNFSSALSQFEMFESSPNSSNYIFNENLFSALGSLSTEMRMRIDEKVMTIFREIDSRGEDGLEVKTMKRNLEAIHQILMKDEFDHFLHQLNPDGMSANELIPIVNNYFAKLFSHQRSQYSSERGGYSFSKVLGLIKIIQESGLSKQLDEDAFVIYGSVPNGKANLAEGSDLDSFFTGKMSNYYTNYVNYFSQEMQDGFFIRKIKNVLFRREKISGSAQFSKSLLDIDRQVARLFGRVRTRDKTVLSITPRSLPSSGSSSDTFIFTMGVYNPFFLRIHREKAFLMIYDRVFHNGLLEIPILP